MASEFPEFEILDAEGSTVTGADAPSVTEQDVRFSLRHRELAFYTSVQYDQVFPVGAEPPGWTMNATQQEVTGLTFQGNLDERTRSLVRFFSRRYPDGEFTFEGADVEMQEGDVVPDGDQMPARIVVWLFPRTESARVGCWSVRGHSETYIYDSKAREWSVE